MKDMKVSVKGEVSIDSLLGQGFVIEDREYCRTDSGNSFVLIDLYNPEKKLRYHTMVDSSVKRDGYVRVLLEDHLE